MAEAIARSQHEVNLGIHALRRGRKDEAGIYFWRALDALDAVDNERQQRDVLSEIAQFFLTAGFEDLALMAVADAMALDAKLGFPAGMIRNRMTHANVHMRLGNHEAAEASYRELIEHCVKHGELANAASASTNLAIILANEGYRKEAIGMLAQSLRWLEQDALPETEIITRITLVQVLEFEESDPARIFDEARALLDRQGGALTPQYLDVLRQFIDQAAKRQGGDAEQRKRKRFPELYGGN